MPGRDPAGPPTPASCTGRWRGISWPAARSRSSASSCSMQALARAPLVRCSRDLGATVVESDFEPTMLEHGRAHRPPAAAADVGALPFRAGVFDAVIAAFVLNHVADASAALAELARVTRPGGAVLASTFAASRSPAKEAFDTVAERHGWRSPAWHDARQRPGGRVQHDRTGPARSQRRRVGRR